MTDSEPLLHLLRELRQRDYQFTAVTPATHALVISRPFSGTPSLRDIFGWNRPFAAAQLDATIMRLLETAGAVEPFEGLVRSCVRVATLGEDLFLHSAFPTDTPDSVFFGPDTYRFAHFIRQQMPQLGRREWVVDMGSGSGAGGIVAARLAPGSRLTLVDVNAAALRLSQVNAAAAGVAVEVVNTDRLPQGAELVVANPPYMVDPAKRSYRNGGSLLGGAIALDWTMQALDNMAPRGVLILYTGAAFVEGEAPLIRALRCQCRNRGAALSIEELDPDVFGDELGEEAYSTVDRIGVIGAVISLGSG